MKKGPKNLGMGKPPPPFRAMPERKRVFTYDLFPNIQCIYAFGTLTTNSQNRESLLCRSVIKNLTLCMIDKIIFKKYHVEAYDQSFPMMYNTIYSKMNGLALRSNFLQKSARKTAFLRDTKPNQLTLEGAGTPILKLPTFFTCSLKTLGHKLSDELLWRPLASILSDRRPLEHFYQRDTKKCKKTHFFTFGQISGDFELVWPIQGRTMWKLTSWGFRKCGSFWDLEVLNQSYRPSKLTQISVLKKAEMRCWKKKTRPQFSKFMLQIESAWN